MRTARAFLFPFLCFSTFACGGLTVDEPTSGGPNVASTATPAASTSSTTRGLPTPVFVADSTSCSTSTLPSAEEALRREDSSDTFTIAEVRYVEECSGLGGTWIVGLDLEWSVPRFFHLGGHGCALWETPPRGGFAVVRLRQTAGHFRVPEGACIAFDGREYHGSSLSTRSVVVFETRLEAEMYAALKGIPTRR